MSQSEDKVSLMRDERAVLCVLVDSELAQAGPDFGPGPATVESLESMRAKLGCSRMVEEAKRRGEATNREAQAPLPASVSATPEGSQRGPSVS